MIPEWGKSINAYLWLSIASFFLIAVSTIYGNEKHIDLWFVSFLYGLFGFAWTVKFSAGHKRTWGQVVLLIGYVLVVIYIRMFRVVN